MEHAVAHCECGDSQHTVFVSYDKAYDEYYLNFNCRPHESLWDRIRIAWKFILGMYPIESDGALMNGKQMTEFLNELRGLRWK